MLSCDRQVSWLFKMRISVEVSEKPQAQGRTVYARVKGNEVRVESEMFRCKRETLTPLQLFVVHYNYLKSFS